VSTRDHRILRQMQAQQDGHRPLIAGFIFGLGVVAFVYAIHVLLVLKAYLL